MFKMTNFFYYHFFLFSFACRLSHLNSLLTTHTFNGRNIFALAWPSSSTSIRSIQEYDATNEQKVVKNKNKNNATSILPSTCSSSSTVVEYDNDEQQRIGIDIFSLLARTGKTKRRLLHFLDLVESCNECNDEELMTSIADIGCDHGILTFALAYSHRFSSVIGVDASRLALENGALTNMKKLGFDSTRLQKQQQLPTTRTTTTTMSNSSGSTTTIEFRLGNGLTTLNDREVDCICLAGMGVDTMIQVLFSSSELERIGCEFVYVQPSSARPRHLMKLYDALQMKGYELYQERIEEFSSGTKKHWYITAAFVKRQRNTTSTTTHYLDTNDDAPLLPGAYLSTLEHNNITMYKCYMNFVNHHRRWIVSDSSQKKFVSNEDMRWLQQHQHQQNTSTSANSNTNDNKLIQ